MPKRYIEISGNYLASLSEQAGYSQEAIDYYRRFGSKMIEVSKAAVDKALADAGQDMIPRDVVCY